MSRKPSIEKIEFDKQGVVGERPAGELFANEEADLFWKYSYVVGFDDHTNIGALVNADNDGDAVDAAADFYEDLAPGYFLSGADLDDYDEDELTFVGNHGLPVKSHLIWVVPIPNKDVPPASGDASGGQMEGWVDRGDPAEGAGDIRFHAPPIYILYREDFHDGALYFVSHFPGEGVKDWGYDMDPRKAKRASPYWVKRFRADMQRAGQRAGVREETGFGDMSNVCIRTLDGKVVCGARIGEKTPHTVRLMIYQFGRTEDLKHEEVIAGPTLFDAILTAVLKGYRSDHNFLVVEAEGEPHVLYWPGRVHDRNIVDDRERLEHLILDRLAKLGHRHVF